MRYLVAGLLIAVGAVLGAFGILQKAIWAPDEAIIAAVQFDEPGSLVVVQPGVLNLYPGPAQLTVRGAGEISISQASVENVDAWVGDAEHSRITGLAEQTVLAVDRRDGEAESADPRGRDLFVEQTVGEGEAVIGWDAEAGRTAFLIAGDGRSPAADSVEISWPNDTATPWALPLMIGGGVLMLAGLALGVQSLLRGRKERKRREARQQRRRALAETGMAFAIVPVIALAGCGAPDLPTVPELEPLEAPAPTITDAQLERILSDAAAVVAKADEDKDAKALESRATGPFLDLRTAAYAVADEVEDHALPPAVAVETVNLNVTTATAEWPRITSAVTSVEDSAQTQLLVLVQESPRSDYRLWSQTILLPGSEIPEIPDARQGTAQLPGDHDGLLAAPQEIVERYADVLKSGGDSDHAETFTEDGLRSQVADAQKAQREALKAGNASIAYDFSAAEEVMAQQTADGGALVTGRIEMTSTISPESVEGRTGTIEIPAPQKDILGQATTRQKLVTKTEYLLTFVVPPGEDGQVALIGVVEVLSGAELA